MQFKLAPSKLAPSKLAPSKLIVCSIKKSLYPGEHRKGEMWPGIDPWKDDDGKPTNPDYIYFKNLEDRGYDYIVIDGNNRKRNNGETREYRRGIR